MIYLDNAATTWPKPTTVYGAVDYCLRNLAANPGRGGHAMARDASMLVYETRELLAEFFAIDDPNRICFTHNATDSINMALFGLLKSGDTVITTDMEHNAVARPLRWLEKKRGIIIKKIHCNQQGSLDLIAMEAALAKGAAAVVMTHASNVTGGIMPVAEVGRLTGNHKTLLMVDAAQTAGVEEVDVKKMGIDILAFSGHKGLLGPQGTGGLYVREGIEIEPLRLGGTGSLSESDRQPDFLPDSLESGTPNTPGIAGLKAGVEFINGLGRATLRQRESELAQQLLVGLSSLPGVRVLSPLSKEARTAVVSITVDCWESSFLARELDQRYGIACRAGLHCAPWAHETLGSLATGAIRLSPGYFTTQEEIEKTVDAVKILCKEARQA